MRHDFTRNLSSLVLAPLLGMLAFFVPEPARACGGTFCDGGTQMPMPVDQTGEDILFIREGAEIEVHVRIQYTGEPERFAWLVPVQAVPEVSVGSEPLFAALSQATIANWRVNRQYECPDDNPNNGSGGGISFIMAADAGSDGPPDIVFEAVVGSFEIVVLQGGSAAEVIDFLQANAYAQDPEAEPILQEYLDEGFLFVAVKLVAGVNVEAIHPLVFRMTASEPCVPLRLTRIAAKQDLGVRVYFLGQDRWAPSNYAHVVLNPLAYDWVTAQPENHVELLTMAVDEAGGRAFATDYAGPSEIVNTSAVYDPGWDETAFVDVGPILALELIDQQDLTLHPLIQSLLLEFIPPPDGVDPTDFWNNLDQYFEFIDYGAWDGPAFAAALAEQIIEPGLHASDLLEAWPKLTRLHTTISPIEMTLDPTFHPNPDLPDVDAYVRTVSQVECGGDEQYAVDVVGDQPTPVCVGAGEAWPTIAGMPSALRIEQVPMAGPVQVSVDQTETALALLATQQAMVDCADISEDDGSDELADESTTGTSYDMPYDTTCGCATSRGQTPLAIGLGLLVFVFIVPRRRRS